MKKILLSFAFLVMGVGSVNAKDLMQTLSEDARLEKFTQYVTMAEMAETLKGEGPFTIFAVSNEQFESLSEPDIYTLKRSNNTGLKNLMQNHVVKGLLTTEKLKPGKIRTLRLASRLNVEVNDGIKVDGAKLIVSNIVADNGVIHIVDKLLYPN